MFNRRSQPPAMSSGKVLPADVVRAQVGPFGSFGDMYYAEASSAALLAFGDDFQAELFRLGVTHWDTRFDCNHFATFYVALAQTRFFVANFQSWTAAQTLAVGELWYRRNGNGPGHAIVIALTESGRRFIEPQTQQFVTLTDNEWASRFLVKF